MLSHSAAAYVPPGMTDAQRTEFWASLALRHTAGLGARRWKRLLETYPSPYAAVLDAAQWKERCGLPARLAAEFSAERWRTAARQEWDAARKGGWRVLLWTDPRYPRRLKEIGDPPLLLYYAGDTALLGNPGVAVVGSRKCSRDGVATTRELCRRFSASGVTTISGLARGIDSEAHRAALESWGSTIAVLGTGPDIVYPPENDALHARISESGLVLSEFAPGTMPEPRNFPMRNRIISALSLGVLVVEATRRSGSLITAQHALDQGREVFAVPGSALARTSSGCHELIRQGAKAVFSCDDVLVEIAPLIGFTARDWKTPEQVPPPEAVSVRKRGQSAATGRIGEAGGVAEDETLTAESATPSMHAGFSERVASGEPNDRGVAGKEVTDNASADEKEIYALLTTQDSLHIDELCRALGWEAGRVSGALLMLEVLGAVRQLPGMHYCAMQ